jgi:branched-chain amino acid transport system permease protein
MTTTTPAPAETSTAAPNRPGSRWAWLRGGGVAAGLVLAAMLPLLVSTYSIELASTAVVLAVLALSTQLLVGVTGLPSFGQGAYYGIGAYTAALLAQHGMTTGPVQLVAAAAAGALAAAVTAPIVLRTRGTAFLMVTFAIQSLIQTLASQWASLTNGDEGLQTSSVRVWFGTAPLTNEGLLYWYVFGVFVVLAGVLALVLRSRLGLVLRGCAAHEPRMASLGHRVTGELAAGHVVAGALAGAGGALLVAVARFVSPGDLGFETAAIALLAAAIGSGSLIGAVIGAVLVVVARDLIGGETNGHAPALLAVLFFAVAYGRPAARALRARLRTENAS